MSFPTKEERAKCWDARDKYWQCLDQNGEKEAVTEGPCASFRKFYEKSCSSQWVKHFDRKRSYLIFKERIEKEGIPNNNQQKLKKRKVYSGVVL